MVMIPGCPTEAVLTPAKARSQVDLREYGIYLTEKLTEASCMGPCQDTYQESTEAAETGI